MSEENSLLSEISLTKRRTLLFIAYAINPHSGSESGGGWALLQTYLNSGFYVYIICGYESEFAIQQELKSYPEQFEVVQVKNLRYFNRFLNFLPFGLQLKSLFWNLSILFDWKSLLDPLQFNFVHYATFAGDWNFCAPLFKRKIPLLWGPIGGTQKVPIKLFKNLGFIGGLSEVLRFVITFPFRFINKLLVLNHSNIKILCLNDATQKYFRSSKSEYPLVTNVVLPCLTRSLSWSDKSSNYYFAAGRLIPLKNWGLAIKSLALIGDGSLLLIAGTGIHQRSLQKLANSLNVQDRIIFLGQVTHDECINLMLSSKGIVFPSLRDSASWFLAEAAHYGAPIVTLDTPGSRSVSYFSQFDLVPIGSGHIVKRFSEHMINPPIPLKTGQFCKCKMEKIFSTLVP